MKSWNTPYCNEFTTQSNILTLSQTSPGFLQHKSFENTVGKGETARNEQFLLFPQCFLSIWRTSCHVHQNWNGGLQALSIWKSLKFVFPSVVSTHPKKNFCFLSWGFLSLANAFNLDQSKSFGKELKTQKRKALESIVEQGQNAGNQHFLLFPTMFAALHKTNSNFI